MQDELPENPDAEKPASPLHDFGKTSQTIELIEHIARSALECAGASGAFLALSGPVSVVSSSVDNQVLKSLIRDQPPMLEALTKGECVTLSGLAADIFSFQRLNKRSVALIPVKGGTKLHGVLCVV